MSRIDVLVRSVIGVAALVAGAAHVSLYVDGYRDVPVANIGTQFLLNAGAAGIIALGLAAPIVVRATPRWVAWAAPAAAAGWAATSLLAFWLARTSIGWMGFRDGPGLNPAPEAALSVFPEIVVLVGAVGLLAASVARAVR